MVVKTAFIEDDDLLEHWKFLPYRLQVGDMPACVALYRSHIESLVKQDADPEAQIIWSRLRCPAGLWIGGVRRLDWDTELFELPIGRLEPLIGPDSDLLSPEVLSSGTSLVQNCLTCAGELGLKLVSVAVDAGDTASQLCLQGAGFRMMDTIVTYQAKLSAINAANFESSGTRTATENDIEPLASIAGECFGNRRYSINRFNSEPVFQPSKVRQLYADWLRNLFRTEMADQVLVADEQDKVVGFIGLKLPSPVELRAGLNVGRVPLNAVHPEYQARGVYTRLVKAALNWFREHGTENVQIGTQVTGLAVHRVWQKLGASVASSHHTFHFVPTVKENQGLTPASIVLPK